MAGAALRQSGGRAVPFHGILVITADGFIVMANRLTISCEKHRAGLPHFAGKVPVAHHCRRAR